MTDTNEGNKFCFSYLQNREQYTIKVIGIYIGTLESVPVEYHIRSGVTGVSKTGTVQPGEINRELYQYDYDDHFETDSNLNPPRVKGMVPLSSSNQSVNDHTGIIVETVNSSQKIMVMGFNDGAGSSEGFTAVPLLNTSFITKYYNYSVFTTSGNASAVAAIVSCDTIEAGGVTIDNLVYCNYSIPTSYFTHNCSDRINPSSVVFQPHYNPVLFSNNEQLSGVRVISTQPIGFMTGHECGTITTGDVTCDHLIEQIPPSYTWGYNFLITPFHSGVFGYLLRLLPARDYGTNFKVFCTTNATVTVNVFVANFTTADRLIRNRGTFDIASQSYCTIQSNRPLAVMQYGKGRGVSDQISHPKSLGDPFMVWIPAVSQYLNKYLISNEVSIRSQHLTSNGVYVTVLPECFNTSAILDNGVPVEPNANKWGIFYCDSNTDLCGYGISVDIPLGTHLLSHSNTGCSFSAIVFGWGTETGYAYPAGYGMRPIAGNTCKVIVNIYFPIETFYSVALEDTLDPLSVVVYKSGDISEASKVQLTTIASCK